MLRHRHAFDHPPKSAPSQPYGPPFLRTRQLPPREPIAVRHPARGLTPRPYRYRRSAVTSPSTATSTHHRRRVTMSAHRGLELPTAGRYASHIGPPFGKYGAGTRRA